jgi:hypothetical protein
MMGARKTENDHKCCRTVDQLPRLNYRSCDERNDRAATDINTLWEHSGQNIFPCNGVTKDILKHRK